MVSSARALRGREVLVLGGWYVVLCSARLLLSRVLNCSSSAFFDRIGFWFPPLPAGPWIVRLTCAPLAVVAAGGPGFVRCGLRSASGPVPASSWFGLGRLPACLLPAGAPCSWPQDGAEPGRAARRGGLVDDPVRGSRLACSSHAVSPASLSWREPDAGRGGCSRPSHDLLGSAEVLWRQPRRHTCIRRAPGMGFWACQICSICSTVKSRRR